MSNPTAAAPHTITLAWTPDQNLGRVSTLRNRTPLFAVLGLLSAGEDVETVAHEYGLAIEEVLVLDQLRRELDDDPPEPTYEQIQHALDDAFGCAAITVTVREAGGAIAPPWRLARCLSKQGLIDAAAFRG